MVRKTKEKHKKELKAVFQTLLENQLFSKPTKCQFCQKSLTFLGHIISGEGVKAEPEKYLL